MKGKRLNSVRSLISMVLCLSIVASMFLFGFQRNVSAGSITRAMIDNVCTKYGFSSGRYWTYDYNSVGSSTAARDAAATSGYMSSTVPYSSSTYTSSVLGTSVHLGEFIYHGGRQCWAFCDFIGYQMTGSYPSSNWTHYTSLAQVNANGGLQVGDVIRTSGHSAMVLSVSGTTIKTVEVWGSTNSKNKISYNGYFNGNSAYSTLEKICGAYTLSYVARYQGTVAPVYTTPGDFYPAIPTNTKWAVGNHEISWGASTNAQSYSVYVKTPSSSSYTCVASGLTSRSYTYNFSQTGTYVYYIRAVNGDKIKDTQTVTITCGYGPGSYTLNNPGNFTVGTKTISWTASSNATSYTVFLKAPGGSYTSVYSGTALSFSYNFTTVGTYSIYMRAYNNYSESGVVSSSYTFTVSARPTDTPTPTPNNKPGSFSVSSLGIREIGPHTITWTSSARATSYELWVKVPCSYYSTSEYELVYSGPDTSYTYDFDEYSYGQYKYCVVAVNSYGRFQCKDGFMTPFTTMWYTGSYTGSQVDAEGNRSTTDASSIHFHLVGLSNVEMYYTVVKDGVLVYTSPTGYYDYQGPVYGTYDAENGNAPLVNGCLQKGLYTITYYYANGDFLTSSSITVINTAMNTPTPTATSTPTPTDAPITPTPAVPTQVPCNPAVADFVERLYTVALGRTSEQEGKNYWITALQNGASGAEAAHGFFFAPEVTDANLSNVEFVTRLYRTFMDRSPDDAGLEYWINAIYSGMTREEVFYGFINSTEWINICENCGINPGANTNPDDGRRELVVAFATRLYSTCLGREGDQGGIDYWTDLLISGNATGTFAAHEFFFGPEFVDGNYSNVEFIRRLYLTFMGREADDGGLEYWLTSFSNGMTREQVFAGFANSDEFREICNQAGIQP